MKVATAKMIAISSARPRRAPPCSDRHLLHLAVVEMLLAVLVCLALAGLWRLSRMWVLAEFPSGLGTDRSELNLAIETGDEASVIAILENGIAIDAVDSDGLTPLGRAARSHNLRICRLLIEHGADVDAHGEYGDSPLTAASNGDVALMKYLLERGADPDDGVTTMRLCPIRTACLVGPVEAVKLLVEGGADVNACGPNGFTPLMAAAAADKPQAVRLLLHAGADASAIDDEGNTALHRAAAAMAFDAQQPTSILLLLHYGADPTMRNRAGQTPLDVARKIRHRKAIELLR